MPLKFLSTFVLFLFAASSSLEANAQLRATPRQLQTYTQLSDYAGLMLERVNLERAVQAAGALREQQTAGCGPAPLGRPGRQRLHGPRGLGRLDDVAARLGRRLRLARRGRERGRGPSGRDGGHGRVDELGGHRHNILGDYTMLGVAYAYTPDGLYRHFWTQDFGRSDTEQCDGSADTPVPTTTASPSFNSSGSSSDNTMSAPNRRDSRGTSATSSISPPTPTILILLTSTVLHLI